MDRFNELLLLVEKTSKKEQHRMDNFLKRHKYDPKTGTIETDEIGRDGKKLRVKFNITNSPKSSDRIITSKFTNDDDSSSIEMPRSSLKRKPMFSDGILKHEEGHLAYKRNPKKYKELYDKAKKCIDNDKSDKNDHGMNPEEYVADWYSAKHSKYGINGLNKTLNCLKNADNDINRRIKKINTYFIKNKDVTSQDIKNMEMSYSVTKTMVKSAKESLDRRKEMLNRLKLELSRAKKGNSSREKIESLQSQVDGMEASVSKFATKRLNDYNQQLMEIREKISDAKNSIRSPESTRQLLNTKKNDILKISREEDNKINNEMSLRQKFVNDNIKESTDVLLDIYEAEYNGDITPEERDILINYLREKK